MNNTAWIEVDRAGLAQVIADRPKSFLLFELIQNALDEDVTLVDVKVERLDNGLHRIEVADDSPDGYQDIRHAWTLYAPSKKILGRRAPTELLQPDLSLRQNE